MKKFSIVLIAIAAMCFAPSTASSVAARHTTKRIVCPSPTNAASAAVYTNNASAKQGDFYVDSTSPSLWQETNGKAGLQRSARRGCWAADKQVSPAADVPSAPSAPGVPSVPPGTPKPPAVPNPSTIVPSNPTVPGVPSTPGVPSPPAAPKPDSLPIPGGTAPTVPALPVP
jgi:hypothetical protein